MSALSHAYFTLGNPEGDAAWVTMSGDFILLLDVQSFAQNRVLSPVFRAELYGSGAVCSREKSRCKNPLA